jgi:hypothetical protein
VEEWPLLADWLVAAGTIAAAVVALWLGVSARRATAEEARERRLRENRQVVSVFQPDYDDRPDTIRIIKSSSEVSPDGTNRNGDLEISAYPSGAGVAPAWVAPRPCSHCVARPDPSVSSVIFSPAHRSDLRG